MSDARRLFRQAALDRLSSPDQLDRLVPVTTPARWIALAGFAVLSIAAVWWSLQSYVPTRVEGRGVLLSGGGSVVDASAVAGGTIASVAVRVGDLVAKDQVLAHIAQPALQQALDNALLQMRELAAEQDRLKEQFASETKLKRDVLGRQRAAQQAIIADARQRSAYYQQTLQNLNDPVQRGYVTRQRLQDIRQELQTAEQEIKTASSQLAHIDGEELDEDNRHNDELTRSAMRVSEAKRRVDELDGQLRVATLVVAPTGGRVIEVKVQEGAYVPVGTALASIQNGGGGLELALFIPIAHGKDVKPGMAVQVEPASVKKEEFGTIIGRVVSVSEFPATAQGLMAVLQNSDLVRQFSDPAPPYAARVELLRAPDGGDGYAWSSGRGPPNAITSGTLAAAEITIRRQHPIELVLPSVNKALGWTR